MNPENNTGNISLRSKYIQADDLRIHYLEEGSGFPTVLLHGWPTSSYLWRNIIPKLAGHGRIIAPDMIGYGKSDKPLNIMYNLSNQAYRLDAFLNALNLDKINLVVHDLGGPVGLLWAVRNNERVNKLVITDTILFPELKGILFTMRLLILAAKVPFFKNWLSSRNGIKKVMRLGVYRREKLTEEKLENYVNPFITENDRAVYLKNLKDWIPRECKEIISNAAKLNMPIKIICGNKDFVMKDEMHRIKELLNVNDFELLPNASHFLQEDQPDLLSKKIEEFLFNKN